MRHPPRSAGLTGGTVLMPPVHRRAPRAPAIAMPPTLRQYSEALGQQPRGTAGIDPGLHGPMTPTMWPSCSTVRTGPTVPAYICSYRNAITPLGRQDQTASGLPDCNRPLDYPEQHVHLHAAREDAVETRAEPHPPVDTWHVNVHS